MMKLLLIYFAVGSGTLLFLYAVSQIRAALYNKETPLLGYPQTVLLWKDMLTIIFFWPLVLLAFVWGLVTDVVKLFF